MTQGDDRLDDCNRLLVPSYPLDETLVDLETVYLESLEVAQARIASAEIVQGDPERD